MEKSGDKDSAGRTVLHDASVNTQCHTPAEADLLRLISEQEAVCRTLLQTIYEERRAIRSLDLEQLHIVNDKRLTLLESLQRLSREANETVKTLLPQQGDDASVSFQMVSKLFRQEMAAAVRARYDSFHHIAQVVREELRKNSDLVEAIRSVFDQTVSAASLASWGADGYGSDGRRITMSAHGFLSQQG